jgi:hypothetical protein
MEKKTVDLCDDLLCLPMLQNRLQPIEIICSESTNEVDFTYRKNHSKQDGIENLDMWKIYIKKLFKSEIGYLNNHSIDAWSQGYYLISYVYFIQLQYPLDLLFCLMYILFWKQYLDEWNDRVRTHNLRVFNKLQHVRYRYDNNGSTKVNLIEGILSSNKCEHPIAFQ